MKKLIAILMILTLAIGLIPAGQADDDGFLFELEKVIQGGEVYWARGITGLWIRWVRMKATAPGLPAFMMKGIQNRSAHGAPRRTERNSISSCMRRKGRTINTP